MIYIVLGRIINLHLRSATLVHTRTCNIISTHLQFLHDFDDIPKNNDATLGCYCVWVLPLGTLYLPSYEVLLLFYSSFVIVNCFVLMNFVTY